MSDLDNKKKIFKQFEQVENSWKQELRKYVPVQQKIQVLVEAYYLGFIPNHLYKEQFADLMDEEQQLEGTTPRDQTSIDNEGLDMDLLDDPSLGHEY